MDRERVLIDTTILIDHLRRGNTEIYHDLRATNRLIALPDLLIAATAVAHGLPLLTLNLSHFERVVGLTLLDLSSL